jgi:putative chitinase
MYALNASSTSSVNASIVIASIQANSAPIPAAPPPQNPFSAITPHLIAPIFPATPLANITANLPPLLAALIAANLADNSMLLMALATIRAETECFLPLSEQPSRFNTSPGGHPFNLYDSRHDLGNLAAPDGASFRGRGFVQLTGRANYTLFAHATGHDLVANPALACEPAIAAELLARFLANKQAAIRLALAAGNLAQARRLVNGGTNGLDRFTSAFQIGLSLLAVTDGNFSHTI